jgi:peptidoglycan/xylan/chitin deacetylase (PgdA/CDA1 family)
VTGLGRQPDPSGQLRVPILMYHEIAARPETASRLAVPPAAFAAQLAYLHDAGFSTVTFADAAAALAGETDRLPARPVVLTFDDGFADFHREALPLLQRYGFTATVFVTTGWIADAGAYKAGRGPGQMLCWNQIREAAGAGVEIGAHSHGHPQLDQIAPGQLHNELAISKALLEDGPCSAWPIRSATPVPGCGGRPRPAVTGMRAPWPMRRPGPAATVTRCRG